MTDFSVESVIEAKLDRNSVSRIEQELEDVGPIEVEATVSASQLAADKAGGRPQSAMTGALDTANKHLTTIVDHGSELVDLAEERNTLLRENLDANEMAAQQGGGLQLPRLPNIGNLLIGGGILATAVATSISQVAWDSVISGAIDPIKITTGDVIDTTLSVGDVVEDPLPIGVGALLATTPLVLASDVVGSDLPIKETNILKDPLPIGVGALLSATPLVSLTNILPKNTFPLSLGNVLNTDAFPINVDDLIEQAQGEGSAEDTGDNTGDNTGDGTGGGLPWEELAIGGSIAIAGGALAKTVLASGGGPAAGAFGPISRGMFADIAGEDTISPTGIGENIPEDERMTNRELILSTIASEQAPIMAGSTTSATGTISPTPDPDADAPSLDQTGTSNSGPVTGLSDLPEKDRRLIQRVLSQQPSLTMGVEFRDGGLAPNTRQRLQSRLDSSGDNSTAGGSGGSGGSADTTQSESSRGTPDRPEVTVNVDLTNEVETALDISNERELQKFLRDPERYISDQLDFPGGL